MSERLNYCLMSATLKDAWARLRPMRGSSFRGR
jgi:hypothetical protein